MAIAVTCPSCRASYRLKDACAGQRGQCPKCRALLEVPGPVAATGDPVPALDPAADDSAPGPAQALLMQEILNAFTGEVSRVPVTLAYRVGILLVTAAVLLLPLAYLALIATVGTAVYFHATVNVTLLRHFGAIWLVLFGYVGPLLAGVILLFFLIKPLFAGHARAAKLRSLEFGQEPLLFAFVTRVARAVRAPEPKRIDVDCCANASAGFGSGLRGLFGRDLVLTIGLPLVAGLDIQQLAGVLAHELGHFSQGTGMRLSYLIRSINAWFVRVVYERDDWDEALVGWSEESGRLSLIFLLARFCVWLTRGILWLFMVLSHALSSFLLRQMEYDADRYEARLAGSKAFAKTSRQLVLLNLATEGILAQVVQAWYQGAPLPDDLCPLILHAVGEIPRRDVRRIKKALEQERTGFLDTHPAHLDRLDNARRESAAGIFHLDGPATRLFRDFPKLARAVTRDYYRCLFSRRIRRTELVPVAALLPPEAGPDLHPAEGSAEERKRTGVDLDEHWRP